MSSIPSYTADTRWLRWNFVLAGVFSLAVGTIILFSPQSSAMFVAGLVSALVLLAGVTQLAFGFFGAPQSGRAGHVALGIMLIVLGVLGFANLGAATVGLAIAVTIVVAVSWISSGIVAFSLRNTLRPRWLTIAYAVISILGAIALLVSGLSGVLFLWQLLGALLLLNGLIYVVLGLAAPSRLATRGSDG